MQLSDTGSIRLSPSDLTAYLACPHLTTLSLEVAHGDRASRTAGGTRAARRREGRSARSAISSTPACGKEVVEIELPKQSGAFEEAHGQRSQRCAAAPRSSTRRRSRATAGAAAPTSSFASRSRPTSATGATSRTTRSWRGARSRPPCSSSPGTRARSPRSRGGCRSGCTWCLGTSEIETYRPADVDAYLRIAQRRLRAHVEQRPETYPWPCEHCSRCDFVSVCRERWVERRPPHARRLDPARPDRQARDSRRHDADGARRGSARICAFAGSRRR